MAVGTEDSREGPLECGRPVKGAGHVKPGRAFDCDILGLVALVDPLLDEAWIEGGALRQPGQFGSRQDAFLHLRLAVLPARQVRNRPPYFDQFAFGLAGFLGMATAKALGPGGGRKAEGTTDRYSDKRAPVHRSNLRSIGGEIKCGDGRAARNGSTAGDLREWKDTRDLLCCLPDGQRGLRGQPGVAPIPDSATCSLEASRQGQPLCGRSTVRRGASREPEGPGPVLKRTRPASREVVRRCGITYRGLPIGGAGFRIWRNLPVAELHEACDR